MIRIERKTNSAKIRIIVQGNRSMGWLENVILLVSIGVLSIGASIVLAIMGFWMALPFAGLEFVFLIFCFYKTWLRLEQKEVITIEDEFIKIERGVHSPQVSISTPRYWSRLRFRKSTNPFEVGMLSLLIHNKSYRLGQELGKQEKQQLFLALEEHFSPSNVLLIEAVE